eukprot:COSAG02_NODE_170_length_31534_cov_33.568498_1_plen_101_part_00
MRRVRIRAWRARARASRAAATLALEYLADRSPRPQLTNTMTVITSMEVVDWRYPTSLQGDGSDAVHKDPDVRIELSARETFRSCARDRRLTRRRRAALTL